MSQQCQWPAHGSEQMLSAAWNIAQLIVSPVSIIGGFGHLALNSFTKT